MRKREVVILVNGIQVCDPVRFDFDITPSVLALGVAGPGKKRAEFDRLEIREIMQPDDAHAKAEATPSASLAVEPADLPKPHPTLPDSSSKLISVEKVPEIVPGAAKSNEGKPPEPLAASAAGSPARSPQGKPRLPLAAHSRVRAGSTVPLKEIRNKVGMTLKLIPAGEFMMGSPDADGEAPGNEKPQHRVRITRPFYLGVHEVTQAQYTAVMGNNPSYFSSTGKGKDKVAGQSTDNHPVEQVSWLDAVEFCNKLSNKEGLKPFYEIEAGTARVPDWAGPGYRLPTEAEWEYACRANSNTRYSFGNDEGGLGEHGWYGGNSGGQTHPVGQMRPNAFGLFDMHGNVSEWCSDWLDAGYYKQLPVDDPRGPARAANRVFRGGGWINGRPRGCRSANRGRGTPDFRHYSLGFRLALVQ